MAVYRRGQQFLMDSFFTWEMDGGTEISVMIDARLTVKGLEMERSIFLLTSFRKGVYWADFLR